MHRYGDCSFCGGHVIGKCVELDYGYKGKLYLFQRVPAGVCKQCGERFLTAQTIKVVEKVIRANKKPQKIVVPGNIFTREEVS